MLEPGSSEPENAYNDLLETGTDYIVVAGAPGDEMDERADWAVTHYRNVKNETGLEPNFVAPEAEAQKIIERLNEDENPNVVETGGKNDRWDEIRELEEVVEEDSIHYFTSDYAKAQDKVITQSVMPEAEFTYFGVKSNGKISKKIGEKAAENNADFIQINTDDEFFDSFFQIWKRLNR